VLYKVQFTFEILISQPNAQKAEQGSLVNVISNAVRAILEKLAEDVAVRTQFVVDFQAAFGTGRRLEARRLEDAEVKSMEADSPQTVQAQELPCEEGEVTCNRVCAQVCNGNVECLDGRDEEPERYPELQACQDRVKFYEQRDSCDGSLMHRCTPVADYQPPSWLGPGTWDKDCIMIDETCDSQIDCQDRSDESTELCGATVDEAEPTLRRDWYGMVLTQRKSIKCMHIRQPDQHCAATEAGVLTHVENPAGVVGGLNELEVYACDKSDLITLGSGLRKNLFGANSRCRRMHDVELRRKPSASTCADGADSTLTFADSTPVDHNFVCETAEGSKKIAMSVAVSIKERHEEKMESEPDTTEEDDLLKQVEYACFCDQQIAWTGMSILAFPYESAAQKVCEPYFRRVLRDAAFMIFGALGVVVVNFVLKKLMVFLVALEKHPSWTEHNASLLHKLFWAQFANTALIVLLVNAELHGAVSKVPILGSIGFLVDRIGSGNHEDMTSKWYVSVGASTAFTILMNVFSTAVPPLGMMWVRRTMIKVLFKMGIKPATQEVMNKSFEDPDFDLALRASQIMNVVVTVIAYCGGFPLLLWFGTFYLFASYWLDKYVFLYGAKVPPMYSTSVAKMSTSLIPVGILIHAFLSLWAFGNQEVFPSAAISTAITDQQAILADKAREHDYPERYGYYILSRMLDSFRMATIWQFIICAIIGATTTVYIFSMILGGGDHQVTIAYLRHGRDRILQCFGKYEALPVSTDEEPLYDDHVGEMKQKKIIWDYEMASNPRYKSAANSILRHKGSTLGTTGTGTTAALSGA